MLAHAVTVEVSWDEHPEVASYRLYVLSVCAQNEVHDTFVLPFVITFPDGCRLWLVACNVNPAGEFCNLETGAWVHGRPTMSEYMPTGVTVQ